MSQELIDLAVSKIWCNPSQDNQVIFKLARLTGYNGVMNRYSFLLTTFNLPVKQTRFHIFQIGQIHPNTVDLFVETPTWVKLSDACSISDVGVHVYTNEGVRLSLDQIYYYRTEERNLLIAVREIPSIGKNSTGAKKVTFGNCDVYIQLYRNAFFSSARSQSLQNDVKIDSKINVSQQDIVALQNGYQQCVNKPGKTLAFKNGFLVKNISLITCSVGDSLEYIYDSSVKMSVDFLIKDLIRFDSTLDQCGKYILHHVFPVSTIDYLDDIDMYLLNKDTGEGVLFHRNEKNSLRMLTHKDYSVPVSKIAAFLDAHSDIMRADNAVLRLVIRNSGYDRPLVKEHTRIHELYKLKDDEILQAMQGIDSTVSVWKAAALESSPYTLMMSKKASDITSGEVANVIGYNSLAQMAAYPFAVVQISQGLRFVPVPYYYQSLSTVFEYDIDGKLLTYQQHSSSDVYFPSNINCYKVEFVYGIGSKVLDDTYNTKNQTLGVNSDYRFYIKYKYGDAHKNTWADVTHADGMFALSNNVISWSVLDNYISVVRGNSRFLIEEKTFPLTDGLMIANLTSIKTIDGVTSETEMEIPLGETDIWLNGYYLIENLDYFIDFPTIVITNKEYIDHTLPLQKVLIRSKGLCTSQLQSTDANEFGYVINGRFSVDDQFDVRDDKITRVCVGGRLKLIDEVTYNENDPTFALLDPLNGKPYIVKDIVVPLRSISGLDTYSYRDRSIALDTEISNYLTKKVPSADPTIINPIASKHKLFSPFLSKILSDFNLGILSTDGLNTNYNDAWISDKLKNYQYLLKCDPITEGNRPNTDYVVIHPHCYDSVITVNPFVYIFMERVISLYCKGMVLMSNFVKITS